LGLLLGRGLVGSAGRSLGEVGGEHSGVQVLANALGQLVGELLEVEAMFQKC